MQEWRRYFEKGKASLTDEMMTAILCLRFGWTWQEYQEQPYLFIETIRDMIRAEAEAAEKEQKKAGRR